MWIIFNWLGVLEITISLITGFIFSKLLNIVGVNVESSVYITYGITGLVMIVCDLILRFRKVKATDGKLYEVLFPNNGGLIIFTPVFILGLLWFIRGILALIVG